MTYKELKQKVEELGLSCRFYDFGTTIDLVVDDGFVATFYKWRTDDANIRLKVTVNIDKIHRLLELCCEMARTPIRERGDTK
ncbi:hypothetical protein [uncultured Sneathia sp.]|uniref:hypothetical protein n=1 Tax=uncultured Sneathia sp. TaxID=278067 RepID=UPI0025996556|nr:hypothetical protein [uncultured Sneathia sp.]